MIKGVKLSNGRFTRVDVFPVGINSEDCLNTLNSPSLKERVVQLQKTFDGKKIIVSRDRLEYIKGIPEKLKSFVGFLEQYPEWREKIVLYLICIPDEADNFINSQLNDEIQKMVGSINGQYGTISYTPVHYLYQKLKWEETVAIFSIADAAIITPLR